MLDVGEMTDGKNIDRKLLIKNKILLKYKGDDQ